MSREASSAAKLNALGPTEDTSAMQPELNGGSSQLDDSEHVSDAFPSTATAHSHADASPGAMPDYEMHNGQSMMNHDDAIANHVSADHPGSFLNKMYNPSLTRDTTLTKVFVGGLAWQTKSEALHRHFAQYGEILEAVVIIDKHTGRSKGFGFVTFDDAESAARATANANPIIDNRRTNCNLACIGAMKRTSAHKPRPDYESFEPQSYSVPGAMSMHLQYQIPGVGFSPSLESFRYDYSPEAAVAPMPYPYNATYDSSSTASSPMFSPYHGYFVPQTPPSPAYFYPATPGSTHGQVRFSHFSPETHPRFVAPTGPSGAPMQPPPPPLALPHSHPAAVQLSAPALATVVEGAPMPSGSHAATSSDMAPSNSTAIAQPMQQQPSQLSQSASEVPTTAPAVNVAVASDPYALAASAGYAGRYPAHLPYAYPGALAPYPIAVHSPPARRGGPARYSAHHQQHQHQQHHQPASGKPPSSQANGMHGAAQMDSSASASTASVTEPASVEETAAQMQRLHVSS